MKTRRTDYSHYEIPELEETEFEFSPRSRIEDANDAGHMGDSISFALDVGDAFSTFDA